MRGLGDQRYGVWSLVESILVYLTLFDFGLSASVVRYVARFEAIADPDRRNRVFSTSLALFGIIGVVIFAIAAALGAAGPFLFRIPPDLVVEVAMDVRFAGAQLRTGAAVGHLSQRALRAGTLPHCVGNPGDIPDSRIHPDGDRHHPGGGLIRDSMLAIPKVLASDAFRGSLRQIPLVQRLEATAYRWFEGLAPERREALRDRIKGPKPTPYREDAPDKPWLS